jgi:hypothetical protein
MHLTAGRLALLLGCCACTQVLAQTRNPSGQFLIGLRNVDVDGARTKFDEDLNLPSGVRLAAFDVLYADDAPANLDRLQISLSDLGDSPFQAIQLNAAKYGAFDLSFRRHRSEYFYQDTILPLAAANIDRSNAGDLHHFDFERVQDAAQLAIHLSPLTRLNLDYSRYTKEGDGTTTLDLERDEFELDRPIDERLTSLGVGIQHRWDKLTLIVEERAHDYENVSTLLLPGFSSGQNPSDPAELALFVSDERHDFQGREHRLRVTARPSSKLNVNIGIARQGIDLDMTALETSRGVDFTGNDFARTRNLTAGVGRDIDLADIDVGYLFGPRFSLAAKLRRQRLDQNGLSRLGTVDGESHWKIDTDGAELAANVALGAHLQLSAGWAEEARLAEFERSTDPLRALSEDTDRRGLFARVSYHPSSEVEIKGSIEQNDVDNPYTLASPTQGLRYRASLRYRWNESLALTGSYRRDDQDNDNSGWSGATDQADLRLSYTGARLQTSIGYSQLTLDRDISQLVSGGSRQDLFEIAYAADARFVDGSLQWLLNERLTLGGHLRRYENRGSFPIERDDARGWLRVALGNGYLAELSLRNVDYTEDGYDDYDARIIELATGYRW